MDAGWLAEQLEAGRSIESIAREAGRDPSTVAYWVNKYGLASAARAKARRPRRDRPRRADGAGRSRAQSIRAIAEELGVSATTVRHWLAKFELQTAGARARGPGPGASRELVRELPAPRLDHVGAISAPGATAASGVGSEAVKRSSAARQGDPRRRGRRRMPALRLLRGTRERCSFTTSTRLKKAFALSSRGPGALAGEGTGGGPEVRAPVRQLPCRSRGGGRYYWLFF